MFITLGEIEIQKIIEAHLCKTFKGKIVVDQMFSFNFDEEDGSDRLQRIEVLVKVEAVE